MARDAYGTLLMYKWMTAARASQCMGC